MLFVLQSTAKLQFAAGFYQPLFVLLTSLTGNSPYVLIDMPVWDGLKRENQHRLSISL